MRVYEFAKKQKLSSKEVLALSEKLGMELASHMSVLSDDDVAVLIKAVKGKAVVAKPKVSPKATPKPAVKPEPAKPVVQASVAQAPVPAKPAQKKIAHKKGASNQQRPKRLPPKRYQKRVSQRELEKEVTEVAVREDMPLCKVAQLLKKPEGELILVLLKRGVVCNRNHLLSIDMISDLAHHFGIAVQAPQTKEAFITERLAVEEATSHGEETRWPIVVVMGHVDHGKTTLLDHVRKMNVAAKEKGGITQHLSAYEVNSVHGKIIFLDTPGHEAFSYMRKRGTSVTDMVVLVVAADDGVMPQTVEVIKHAKAADVPILVAINKIDKVDSASALERVKRQLAQYDLLPEDWGGTVICVPISAKTGQGVDELLEMIILQSQMMELKADSSAEARGFILESKQEKGFGPVATVICMNGTLRVGDYFVCGSSVGRVRLLIDSFGNRVLQASPSIPVQVVGFDNFVSLGDWLTVISPQDYLKEKSARKKESTAVAAPGAAVSRQEKAMESIPLLIKTDTHGSRQAIIGVIEKINKAHPDIPASFQIIYSGVGDISERDVDFAVHAGAILLGLHVKSEKNATILAKEQVIKFHVFDIIYKMTEYLEPLLLEHEEEVITLKKKGEAVVRKVFDLKKKGVIAGCYVSDGTFGRDDVVVCLRDGNEIGRGKIVSLQRERKTVKEVHTGFECGFITDSFHGWEVGDTVHCFAQEKKKRSEV